MRTVTSLGSGYAGAEFTFKPIQVGSYNLILVANATTPAGHRNDYLVDSERHLCRKLGYGYSLHPLAPYFLAMLECGSLHKGLSTNHII